MATAVDELLDMLFDMIDEAKNAAFSGEKCVIDRDKALDLIEDAKKQLPVDLAEARKILSARNEYIATAKREAEEIRKRAEIEANQMVSEAPVMNQARQKAREILNQAEEDARRARREANEFIVYWLPRMEPNPYNLISFQSAAYTDHARLTVTPEPDSLLRVFMAWKPLEAPADLPAQELPAFKRPGFTVVEWGGAELSS